MTPSIHFSITQLAKRFGLSRGTLLHYDAKGLLKATARSENNYRVYDKIALERLERICAYRKAGLSLEDIARLLDDARSSTTQILEGRLELLNEEIADLREQQRVLVTLLSDRNLLRRTRMMDKEMWVDVLRNTGLDEDGMHMWHVQFEKASPQAHQDFLESLGLSLEQIKAIRKKSTEQFCSSSDAIHENRKNA